MRRVKIEFHCTACGMRDIHFEFEETDESDEELLRYIAHQVSCPNPKCSSWGLPQDVKATRIVPEQENDSKYC